MFKIFSKRNRSLLTELVRTDFRLRYQDSILGYLWTLVKPMMMFAILYIVFVKFFRVGADFPNFAVYLLLGIVIFSFFQEATMQGLTSIVVRGDLLRKISLPKYIIVISGTISSLINFLLNLIVVILFAVVSGVHFRATILLLPINILELYIIIAGMSFFLSAVYVRFRDLGYIWEIILQAMMYLVPIMYPMSMVEDFSPLVARVILLNPLAQVTQDIRYNLITDRTETVWSTVSNPVYCAIPLILLGLLLYCSSQYFKKSSKKFAEII
ncbi:MAG: ABC transporter permease [Candidatus Ancillula trichonymphae]|jgi:ABC-2 type transport system permease protein|nr:ABC transporter permease [Candidatus Ancillula trichonymphae]